MTLYGSSMLGGSVPEGQPLDIEGASQAARVTKNGLVLYGTDGKAVSDLIKQISESKQKPSWMSVSVPLLAIRQ